MPPLMRSELPVITTTRHHPIVLFRLPGKWPGLGLLALFVWAIADPIIWIVVILLVAVTMLFRWQTWNAERIILTRKRIIRVQGVPETTTSEAFLRVDRVSGMRIVQTVPGKLLDYATIELEAPGNHPDVRRMIKIWHPHSFYRDLRHLVFSEQRPDPDDVGTTGLPEDVTAPLPHISGPTLRKR
jgi:hypothetical protein